MMGWGYMGWGWGIMPLVGWLFMLAVLVALIVLAVWAVRTLFPTDRRSERTQALDLLLRRYTTGEISQAEYEQARRAIS